METEFKPQPEKVEKEFGYIKLMKSETSKGAIYYGWDIKVLTGGSLDDYKAVLGMVDELNAMMKLHFFGEVA